MDDIQFVTAKMNVHLESHGYMIRHLFVPDKYTQVQGCREEERRDAEGVVQWIPALSIDPPVLPAAGFPPLSFLFPLRLLK